MTDWHVIPLGDLIDHEDHDCPCGPTVELVRGRGGDSWIHTHHSLDGRERTETR